MAVSQPTPKVRSNRNIHQKPFGRKTWAGELTGDLFTVNSHKEITAEMSLPLSLMLLAHLYTENDMMLDLIIYMPCKHFEHGIYINFILL